MDTTTSIKSLLEKHPIVGIDTIAFIYHLEENHKYLPFTNVLFEMVENGVIQGITSAVTIMEILVKPEREENKRAIQEYKFILQTFPNLKIKPIDFHTAEKAAIYYRYDYKLIIDLLVNHRHIMAPTNNHKSVPHCIVQHLIRAPQDFHYRLFGYTQLPKFLQELILSMIREHYHSTHPYNELPFSNLCLI